MRRNLMTGALALVLVPATVMMVLRRLPEPEPTQLAFESPTHRVAVAVDEAMRAELASVAPGKSMIFPMPSMTLPIPTPTSGGSRASPSAIDAITIPEVDDSDFPCQFGASQGVTRAMLNAIDFNGKARDGRNVVVSVTTARIGDGAIVDCHGDAALAKALASKIADRLAHPRHKRGSPEDEAALMAFFGPIPARPMTPGLLMPAPAAPAKLVAGEDGKLDSEVRPANGVDPATRPE